MEATNRLERVTVAIDRAPHAAAVVERSARLPLAERASLHLVHVLPAQLPTRVRAVARSEAKLLLDEAQELARRTSSAAGTRPRVSTDLREGEPFVEVIRTARANLADLIVVGGRARRRHGSTTRRVFRKSELPVLVVKRPASTPYRRPLVGADLSDTTVNVVEFARRIAGGDCEWMAAVHAYQIPFEGWIKDAGTDAEYRKTALEQMARLLELLPELEAPIVPVVRKGDARVVLLREAATRAADLIVVGSHRRAGVANALLGKVAEYILEEAPVDVAVARPAQFAFALP